ncbi:uncharacterized protein [Prorops nasuta]|uniref:uncharacterized protein n=1 Tax=Prorops nasuta TaxID=863751 RepID=UPI0034CE340B
MAKIGRCIVPRCSSTTKDPSHSFPKDSARALQWKNKINCDKLNNVPPEDLQKYRVCHKHFRDDDYRFGLLRLLKKDAIPSRNLNIRSIDSLNERGILEEPVNLNDSENVEPSTDDIFNNDNTIPEIESLDTLEEDDNNNNNPPESLGASFFISKNNDDTARRAVIRSERMKEAKRKYKIKKQLLNQKEKLKQMEEKLKCKDISLLNNLSEAERTMIQMIMKNSEITKKARRFTRNEKILALSIYKTSPKAFRYLEQLFPLPGHRTLQRMISNYKLDTGSNEIIMSNLKKAEIADHAIVFMLRGLHSGWKIPISYRFVTTATKTITLVRIIKQTISSLQKINLKVVGTVCDQGSANMAAINYLTEDSKLSSDVTGNILKIFKVGTDTIISIFDPPHLIKGVRNNLLTKNLEFDVGSEIRKIVQWKTIESAYLMDIHTEKIQRQLPKINKDHIYPKKTNKIKVFNATQVFSRTFSSFVAFISNVEGHVNTEIGPLKICKEDGQNMSKILNFFNDLMDSMNGHTKKDSNS